MGVEDIGREREIGGGEAAFVEAGAIKEGLEFFALGFVLVFEFG